MQRGISNRKNEEQQSLPKNEGWPACVFIGKLSASEAQSERNARQSQADINERLMMPSQQAQCQCQAREVGEKDLPEKLMGFERFRVAAENGRNPNGGVKEIHLSEGTQSDGASESECRCSNKCAEPVQPKVRCQVIHEERR